MITPCLQAVIELDFVPWLDVGDWVAGLILHERKPMFSGENEGGRGVM